MKDYRNQNIDLVKRFYATALLGDSGPARYLLDPTIEWIEPKLPGLWFSGAHRGPDAVWKEVVSPSIENIERFRMEMDRFSALGDHVVAIGHFRGRSKATGKGLNTAVLHVWTLRHGKAVRVEAFHDNARWLDAMGQQQPESHSLAA